MLVPPLELAVACLAPHGSAWLRPNGWVWGHVQRAELGARDARERCQGTQGHQGHSRETREKRVSSTHQTTETKEVSYRLSNCADAADTSVLFLLVSYFLAALAALYLPS